MRHRVFSPKDFVALGPTARDFNPITPLSHYPITSSPHPLPSGGLFLALCGLFSSSSFRFIKVVVFTAFSSFSLIDLVFDGLNFLLNDLDDIHRLPHGIVKLARD